MKATFIGDPRNDFDGPEVFHLHGIDFPKGEPVEVSDSVAAALRTNSHFSVGDVQPEKPRSLEDMTKDELEIVGREYGIEVDRRRKKETIIEQVREAMNADNN